MNATKAGSVERAQYLSQVASTIREQINTGSLMALGAHELRPLDFIADDASAPLPSLAFKARILPFTKSGHRSTAARVMQVVVSLNAADLYDVLVIYKGRDGQKVVHYESSDVDAMKLSWLLLALDFDGDSVLNPRYL